MIKMAVLDDYQNIFRVNFPSFWSSISKEQSSYFWLKLKTFNRI